MPSLISELLFAIARAVVEDGSQEDVYKFAFSGIEPFEAMKHVFASVTVFRIYQSHYEIGWDTKFCKFEFQSDKPHFGYLMRQIGDCVVNLHIDTNIIPSIFELLMIKIRGKKQLTSITIGDSCDTAFLDQFLPQFALSLKNAYIPNEKMTPTFRDSLNLKSLTILDPLGNGFNQENKYASFCCRTNSLKFEHRQWNVIRFCLFGNIFNPSQISPHYSSITTLILEDARISDFWKVLKFFPSLEMVELKSPMKCPDNNRSHMELYVSNLCDEIAKTVKIPSEVKLLFCKAEKNLGSMTLDQCKEDYAGFEYVELVADYHCFRKTLQSAGNESVNFEVRIAKFLFAKTA